MVTEIEVAEIALTLPGAHQGQHVDTVDFRVDNHTAQLRELITEAWRRVAPATQLRGTR